MGTRPIFDQAERRFMFNVDRFDTMMSLVFSWAGAGAGKQAHRRPSVGLGAISNSYLRNLQTL